MQSILNQLYLGNLAPLLHCAPETPEYPAVKERADQMEDEFLARLTPEEEHAYFLLATQLGERSTLEHEQSFLDGFRLAARLVLEALVP